ncbi:MAG TPA: ATP synthase subunit C [Verrucomicrobiae bacterium]|nr:ATP synthase subunit C [Verrucomicrobiae bacterium]
MKWIRWMAGVLFAGLLLLAASGVADEAAPADTAADASSVYKAVGLGGAAAFTIALCVIGASYAVGRIGSAALGAAAEKPELLTRSILFVALAEGLAVLGFAIAMMLVQKI